MTDINQAINKWAKEIESVIANLVANGNYETTVEICGKKYTIEIWRSEPLDLRSEFEKEEI